ncbi:RelA/SpoT domain-containing protein [Myroides odoratimimus]|uniref:RelA/SpoT domain-containing protein n=1 Tax=Myroides odoratimimus TaxID=76832 RepID=UPI0025766EB6|nr:hypothetical protein [Myroides odoratimimus]MDM1465265.1 addiction module component [Myroides odoratimimus]MDM1475269.1 addiction module component [Myroides odoratimimus]
MENLINKDLFLEKYNITEEEFNKTTLDWSDLNKIYINYIKEKPNLEASAVYLFNSLMKAQHVHSVRYRIKDEEHVIEKIIRKRIDNPERIITIENYQSELTDLIGLRALHLFKEEWLPIHNLIVDTWDLNEKPIVYHRQGDSEEYLNSFKEEEENLGIEIKEHFYGYRSIHYIVKTKPSKITYYAEIQVRTIFEEAWSEIDHKIRYPYDVDNAIFGQFLLILNRLAGSADEMGTFISSLKINMELKENDYQCTIKEKDSIILRLEEKIKDLGLEESDQASINEELDKLKESDKKVNNSPIDITKKVLNLNSTVLDLINRGKFDSPKLGINSTVLDLINSSKFDSPKLGINSTVLDLINSGKFDSPKLGINSTVLDLINSGELTHPKLGTNNITSNNTKTKNKKND